MNPAKTAATEAAASSESINVLFHAAMLDCEKAVKSGIQFQEHMVSVWKDLLARTGTPTACQSAMESTVSGLFPNAYACLGEMMEAFSVNMMLANRAGSQAADLFGKAMGIWQSASPAEAQIRTHDLVESSLAAVRGNVHTALNTNTRIMRSWSKLTDKPSAKEFGANAKTTTEEKPAARAK